LKSKFYDAMSLSFIQVVKCTWHCEKYCAVTSPSGH